MAARLLIVVHLAGLGLVLGSIFSHIVASALGGTPGGSPAFLAARRQILWASRAVTMPGLWLALAAEAALAFLARPLQTWMLADGALGAAVLLLGLLFVMPAVKAALTEAVAVSEGRGNAAKVAGIYRRESAVGAVNVLLILAMLALAAWQPGL